MIVQEPSHDANQLPMVPYTMSKTRKLPLSSLNEYLTCKLCRGYYIDATTIIECLHSFCRSCIVKYLETNKYCPICDVQVHKTKPLINIRSDKILQSCVYKLVPRLFQNEMLRRKGFYASHPEAQENLDMEELGEASYQHILAPDENICVALNYKGSPLMPRYLQCSAAVSIFHLQKLIRSKYDLSCNHNIDILHEDDVLKSYLTLIDVAYTSLWRRRGPLELSYRIYESTLTSANLKLISSTEDNQLISNNNNNNASNDWKEVQIQISENGEMSVTGIQDCLELLDKMDDKSTTKLVDRNSKKDALHSEDLKCIKNNTSKITKVELNQPVSQNSCSDEIMTICESISLPAVTLTASEIKELSKVEEAAKTQLSDTIILPPPAKKSKKELPDLKLINTKSQKKNGSKIIHIPHETLSKNDCETSNSPTPAIFTAVTSSKPVSTVAVTSSKPVSTVNVTSVTVIPASTTYLAPIQTATTNTVSTTALITSSIGSTITTMSKDVAVKTATASPVVTNTSTDVIVTVATSISSIVNSTSNTISNVRTSIKNITPTTSSAKLSTIVTQTNTVATVTTSNVQTTTNASSSKRKHPSSLDNTSTTSPDQATAHKLPKPTILNHTLGMQKSLNLSKNHPLTTKHQKALESASAKAANNNNLSSGSTTLLNQIPNKCNAGTPIKSLINVPKVPMNKQQINTGTSNAYSLPTLASSITPSQPTIPSHSSSALTPTALDSKQTTVDNSTLMIKSKASTPIGYKTLKAPPKTWNPTLQPMYQKPGGPTGFGPPGLGGGKTGDLKNVRPAKFFKMRNNMPRYLGCPNSGVKPMFQVHVSPDKEKPKTTQSTPTTSTHNQTTPLIQSNQTTSTTTSPAVTSTSSHVALSTTPTQQPLINNKSSNDQNQNIRKHSIVKIDPKTLKPISEKAPESSNLSTKASGMGSNSSGGGSNRPMGLGGSVSEQKGSGTSQQGSVSKGAYEEQQGRIGSPLSSNDQQYTTPIQSSTSTTSNSNLSLRINTTSVSITNPLKKSPHSPKKSTSPPTNHPLKTPPPTTNKPPPLNQSLNFTPSNPFIPNPLASPTLNPNQFNLLTAAALTAAAAQGYHHGFDPRYHHHLPYHHQLYPPRLPPSFGPAGNWWGSSQLPGLGQSSSASRNSSPRGLIWNGPPTDNKISSPKEAKTASSATMESKGSSFDVALTRAGSNSNKNVDCIAGAHNKSLKDLAHERKDDKSKEKTIGKVALSESEDRSKPVSENAHSVNKVVEKKNISDLQSTAASEKIEKIVQKNTSTSDTPKENAVLAV